MFCLFYKQFSFSALLFMLVAFMWMPLMGEAHYEVQLLGIGDKKAEAAARQVSQLIALSGRSPVSLLALKRRSELDLELFVQAMQAHAYYNAKITFDIDMQSKPVRVVFTFDIGQQYPFLECVAVSATDEQVLPLDMGIKAGDIAYTEKILEAEERLLRSLAARGYPFALIEKRDVVADLKLEGLSVKFLVAEGSLVRFGPTNIRGNDGVKEDFIRGKIAWQEGDIYNPELVDRTRESLESTGLFSLTTITLANEKTKDVTQPIDIQVTENKPRTIAAGLSYTTQFGFGTSLEWEHRNVRGAGERFHTFLNLWQKKQLAQLSYTLPDFGVVGQNLVWSAAISREIAKGLHQSALNLSGILERNCAENLKISYGGMYEVQIATHSPNNGVFHLLKTPFSLRWNQANSLLDPTEGYTLHYRTTPALRIGHHPFAYCPMTLTSTYYRPLTSDKRLVFAGKAIVGTILGASRSAIPPADLFYAGGENKLRGYADFVNSKKLLGGKSIGILSFELRYRLSKNIGLVGFYDAGNAYSSSFIQLQSKQLQSVGAGARWYTPVGPIRFDVAVPLNKRKGIDSNYQFYMSIGQSF